MWATKDLLQLPEACCCITLQQTVTTFSAFEPTLRSKIFLYPKTAAGEVRVSCRRWADRGTNSTPTTSRYFAILLTDLWGARCMLASWHGEDEIHYLPAPSSSSSSAPTRLCLSAGREKQQWLMSDRRTSLLLPFLACILQGQCGSFALCISSQPLLNRGLAQAIAESIEAL